MSLIEQYTIQSGVQDFASDIAVNLALVYDLKI